MSVDNSLTLSSHWKKNDDLNIVSIMNLTKREKKFIVRPQIEKTKAQINSEEAYDMRQSL